jgi:hypothetical protein
MNSRHAAALALVGWFLMTAPVSEQGDLHQDAALSEWTKASHYDSESECDTRRKEKIQDSEDEVELAPKSEADEDGKRDADRDLNAALVSQCVADDDPRLTGSNFPVGPNTVRKLVH